jgi:signal transduction histidine kinase
VLQSDRAKVKQILFNLLSNALKFTPEGSVLITVRYSRARDLVGIAVRDTGIGISAEHHHRVFEDFRQVDSSLTRVFAGAGLGLSICRRFAEALGGRIHLRSKPGHGSTFTLELPRNRRRR